MIQGVFHFLLDLIFPKKCIISGREGTWLSDEYINQLPLHTRFYCFKTHEDLPFGNLCTYCQSESFLDGVFIVTDYSYKTVKKLIHLLKYQYVEDIAEIIAFQMCRYLDKNHILDIVPDSNELVVMPVPLHKKRSLLRGFNQSGLIARSISETIALTYTETCLERIKNTEHQASLNKGGRRKNIKGSFWAKNPPRQVLLVDDVVTTGATLEEAAAALKAVGAEKVYALVYAHNMTK